MIFISPRYKPDHRTSRITPSGTAGIAALRACIVPSAASGAKLASNANCMNGSGLGGQDVHVDTNKGARLPAPSQFALTRTPTV